MRRGVIARAATAAGNARRRAPTGGGAGGWGSGRAERVEGLLAHLAAVRRVAADRQVEERRAWPSGIPGRVTAFDTDGGSIRWHESEHWSSIRLECHTDDGRHSPRAARRGTVVGLVALRRALEGARARRRRGRHRALLELRARERARVLHPHRVRLALAVGAPVPAVALAVVGHRRLQPAEARRLALRERRRPRAPPSSQIRAHSSAGSVSSSRRAHADAQPVCMKPGFFSHSPIVAQCSQSLVEAPRSAAASIARRRRRARVDPSHPPPFIPTIFHDGHSHARDVSDAVLLDPRRRRRARYRVDAGASKTSARSRSR